MRASTCSEPIYTIGQLPLAAGTIIIRNHLRMLKQRERARRKKIMMARLREFTPTIYRFISAHAATAEVGRRPASVTA